MRKSRFSPAEIADILKEATVGASAAEVARKYGIKTTGYYKCPDCGCFHITTKKRKK